MTHIEITGIIIVACVWLYIMLEILKADVRAWRDWCFFAIGVLDMLWSANALKGEVAYLKSIAPAYLLMLIGFVAGILAQRQFSRIEDEEAEEMEKSHE